MTTYIVLINIADRAVQNINQISQRIKNDTAAAEKVGVRVKDIHWTSGVYDAVLVADAPNDKVIKDWADSLGALRTQTVPTFSDNQMNKMLSNSCETGSSSCDTIRWSY